jgi:CHAT domain-containing protein/tetratricopeptide (TPR) repeat protein
VAPHPAQTSESAAGPALEDRAAVIRTLIDTGHLPQAESAARELLAEVERTRGAESSEAARVLDLVVEALWEGGKQAEPQARALAERAVQLKERLHPADDPEVAVSLHNLALVLDYLGEPTAAKSLIERALAIRLKALGPDHIDYAQSLRVLGVALWHVGDISAARSTFERALSICEKTMGPDHPLVATQLNTLGNLLAALGDLAGARPALERAMAIREKALGPEHPALAWSLHNLALLQRDLGEYAEAKARMERALAIMEKALGPENGDVAFILGRLGALLWQMGEEAAARPIFERSLAIKKKILGPRSLDYAEGLSDLGLALYFMGDYASARSLHEQALAVRQEVAGAQSQETAISLNNLALVLIETGGHAQARSMSERAVAIVEKVSAPENTDLARMLDTLAGVQQRMGDAAAAKATYERALAIWNRLDADPPDKALDLDGLADVLADTGDRAGARLLYERALAMRGKIFGPDHAAVAVSLNNLANLDWETGRLPEALERALHAAAIARRQFQQIARGLSEREALTYDFWPVGMRGKLKLRTSGLDIALSVLASTPDAGRSGGVGSRVWDELVRSRALVLDEMASRHRLVLRKESPGFVSLGAALEAARNRLARLAVSGPSPDHPEQYRQNLQRAIEEKERAERALAEKSFAYRQELRRAQVGLADVHRGLPAGSALVAYAQFNRPADPSKGYARAPEKTPSYVCLILKRGAEAPSVVPLGAAAEIDSLVRHWREAAALAPGGLSGAGGREEARYQEAGEALRRAIWDPVARSLGGVRQVFVVPDGMLNLVNLAALPTASARYLVETGPLLHYLSAERDLVPMEKPARRGTGLLIVGAPDYESLPAAPAAALGREPSEQGAEPSAASAASGVTPHGTAVAGTAIGRAALYRGVGSGCPELQAMKFEPLPGSWIEAQEIASLWTAGTNPGRGVKRDVLSLTGLQAGEAAVKADVAGRRVVHLATHGFATPGECSSGIGVGGRKSSPLGDAVLGRVIAENPLLLSGLALAGANRRNETKNRGEDGILTAEEIASLDLTGVEWAVLSACETGVGKVQAGEGVLGLRRAFEVAGAGTLIMSLWSVQDEPAREWMKNLYAARLGGSSTAEAVRAASLRMIEARRKAGRSTHPAFWGAFVAAGDWK